MNLFQHTLSNGIRLAHIRTNGIVGHCGLIINTGSASETGEEHGIAHFIEHMLFKGTKRRKAYHILSRLEDVGGELNAYTTKEETAIHASFLSQHYDRAVDLISDIVLNSVFPEKEIEKEKEVILDEINSYRDNPAELIFDEFEEIIFQNQPIGRSILGSQETVKNFRRNNITDFINKNYHPEGMVLCSAGNIDNDELLKIFEKYFSNIHAKPLPHTNVPAFIYKPQMVTKELDTWQCHCIIGNIAYEVRDERRTGLSLLNNILGGQGLNSRLNLSLREKSGFAYNIESNYNPYYNTGAFSIYFGTDSQNLDKSIALIKKELDLLRTKKLGSIQLNKAKNQMKGYLARGFENYENLMLSLGKSILVFNKFETIDEICAKIDNITSTDIQDIAVDIFDSSELSYLIYR